MASSIKNDYATDYTTHYIGNVDAIVCTSELIIIATYYMNLDLKTSCLNPFDVDMRNYNTMMKALQRLLDMKKDESCSKYLDFLIINQTSLPYIFKKNMLLRLKSTCRDAIATNDTLKIRIEKFEETLSQSDEYNSIRLDTNIIIN